MTLKEQKQYLGDSVYATFDGWGCTITTENGLPTDPSNSIVLTQRVFDALCKFYDEQSFDDDADDEEKDGGSGQFGVGA